MLDRESVLFENPDGSVAHDSMEMSPPVVILSGTARQFVPTVFCTHSIVDRSWLWQTTVSVSPDLMYSG